MTSWSGSAAEDAAEQCQTVEGILKKLDIADKPRITVLNKIDLLLPDGKRWDENSAIGFLSDKAVDEGTVLVSATKGWRLSKLLELITFTLSQPARMTR